MTFGRSSLEDLQTIPKENRFICFGAGMLLKKLCQEAGITSQIDYIVDNNATLWGECFTVDDIAIPTISPDSLAEKMDKDHILLITTTYYRRVIEQIGPSLEADTRTAYYFPNEQDVLFEEYEDTHKGEPLKDILVFRSGTTEDVEALVFSDNAKALFLYLLQNGYNKKYRLVWIVKCPEKYEKYSKYENVEFLSDEWANRTEKSLSDKYYEALYFAKYLFATDAVYWLRNCRPGQIRVNLWHGCGFKDRKNKSRIPTGKNYEYMLVTSPMYARIHAYEYGCDISQMLVTGLPKEDLLFNQVDRNVLNLLGIREADKYIFWLPTFRIAVEGLERLNEYEMKSPIGLPVIDTEEKMQKLDSILGELNIFLVIKLHPVQRKVSATEIQYRNMKVINHQELMDIDVQTNDLLGIANALISDYSSAAVDYMLLDRPIGFAIDDIEEYKNSRGFVFDDIKSYLPGEEIYTFEDFVGFITNVSQGKDLSREKRHRLAKVMHQFNDNNNCKRLVEYLGL